jgi:hypothetical protein
MHDNRRYVKLSERTGLFPVPLGQSRQRVEWETIGAASHLCPDALGCDSARLPEGVWAMFVMSVRMFLLAVVVFALVALGFLIATA